MKCNHCGFDVSPTLLANTWMKIVGFVAFALIPLFFLFSLLIFSASAFDGRDFDNGGAWGDDSGRWGYADEPRNPAVESNIAFLGAVYNTIGVSTPLALVGGAFLLAFYLTRINLLKVEYAGGVIGFDIRWFPMEECDWFQKQLRLAKDRAVEEAENSTANAVTSAMSQFAGIVAQPVRGLFIVRNRKFGLNSGFTAFVKTTNPAILNRVRRGSCTYDTFDPLPS
jgi:hypothetical protein